MYSNNFNTSILGGGAKMTSFINYCDNMMIATEKGLNLFYKNTLAELKQKIKSGETKFTCNLYIDDRKVPLTVDITDYKGKHFKYTIIANEIRDLLQWKSFIKEALNQKYFDKTGMPWSKKGDRVIDMKYYWKSLKITVDRRNLVEVDGILYFENINKNIPYNQIRPVVERNIAIVNQSSAFANGVIAGTLL